LSENLFRLSKHGPESILLPVLFLLEEEYLRLGKNLFSLVRKASRLSENKPESTLFFFQRSCSDELHLLKRDLQSESFLHTSFG